MRVYTPEEILVHKEQPVNNRIREILEPLGAYAAPPVAPTTPKSPTQTRTKYIARGGIDQNEMNPNFKVELGAKHPCLKMFRGCRFGEKCFFKDLPQDWCMLCLLGEEHSECKGSKPDTHPCLRVWGQCRFGDECAFRDYPRDWCLFCLRGAQHTKCSGIKPKNLPKVPQTIRDQCAEHEKKVLAKKQTPKPYDGDLMFDKPREPMNRIIQSIAPQSPAPITYASPPSPLQSLNTSAPKAGGDTPLLLPSNLSRVGTPSPPPLMDGLPVGASALSIPKPTRPLLRQDTPLDKAVKGVRAVYNKITPEKYNDLIITLIETMYAQYSGHPDERTTFIEKSVEIAVHAILTQEPNHQQYSKICHDIKDAERNRNVVQQLAGFSSEQETAVLLKSMSDDFRKTLLTQLQNHFNTMSNDEGVEEEDKHRKKLKANVQFVGMLFEQHYISHRLLERIISGLLIPKFGTVPYRTPVAERVEMLLELLKTCGKMYEEIEGKADGTLSGKQNMDVICKKLSHLANKNAAEEQKLAYEYFDKLRQQESWWRRDDAGMKEEVTNNYERISHFVNSLSSNSEKSRVLEYAESIRNPQEAIDIRIKFLITDFIEFRKIGYKPRKEGMVPKKLAEIEDELQKKR